LKCHAAELDRATKQSLSHRGKAIAQFLEQLGAS
jgi:inosine/xanthosine triphosphate pyrophosphatase family protein